MEGLVSGVAMSSLSVTEGAHARRARPVMEEFSSILRTRRADESPEQIARRTAEEFVAQALVQPVFKLLRGTNKADPPFAPGAHEKTFAPLMDAEIAARIVRARQFPLVDAVARQLLKHSHAAAVAAGAAPESEGITDEPSPVSTVQNLESRR